MRAIWLAAGIVCAPVWAAAQTAVPFGGLSHDASLPVEISAETLDLDQAAGTAVFVGGVTVGQGSLRMAADRVEVTYADAAGSGTGRIERMEATGAVTLSNGTEAAEAARAVYDVASGTVEMDGDVILTQGGNALSSARLRIDLGTGTATMEGRVQTVFVPGSNP